MRVPIYLFQQGGVAPIQTPLMRDTNMTPLIQTASMPIDTGVQVGVQLRAQEIQKQQLRDIERRWQSDRDLRERGLAIQEGRLALTRDQLDLHWAQHDLNEQVQTMGMLKVYDEMTTGLSGTGITAAASKKTGIPETWMTNNQQNQVAAVQNKRNEMSNEYLTKNRGNTVEAFRSLKEDPKSAEVDREFNTVLTSALDQAAHMKHAREEFEKNPDNYSYAGFKLGWTQMHEATDLGFKSNMLLPNLKKVAKDEYNKIKGKYVGQYQTDVIPYGPDSGAFVTREFEQDIRSQLGYELQTTYAHVLEAEYQWHKKIMGEHAKPKEEWLESELTSILNVAAPNRRTVTTHTQSGPSDTDIEKTQEAAILNSPVYGNRPMASYRTSGIEGNLEAPLELDVSYTVEVDPIKQLSQKVSFGAPIITPVSPDPLTDIQIKDLGNIIRAVTGKQGPVAIAKYMDDNGIINKKGRKIVKEYAEIFDENVVKSLNVLTWADVKDDALFSNVPASDEAAEFINTNIDGFEFLDIKTGDILTGEEMKKRFTNDVLTDKERFEVPGLYAGHNLLPMKAMQGNSTIKDPGVWGASPYAATITDEKDNVHRFAIRRLDDWLKSYPKYKAGNNIYVESAKGAGTRVELPKEMVEDALISTRQPGINIKSIAQNGVTVKYIKEDGYGKVELGYNTSKSSGNIKMVDATSSGEALAILDSVMFTLDSVGKGSNVSMEQWVHTETGEVAYEIKIDEMSPIRVHAGDMWAAKGQPALRQYLEEVTSAPGRVDATKYFENANYRMNPGGSMKPDMNLTSTFVSDWSTSLDQRIPSYTITSGFRHGDPTAGKGNTMDLAEEPETVKWFMENVPGLTRTDGSDVKYYSIPDSPFKVAWHQNMSLVRDEQGNVIEKVPILGHHFDIKYK